MKKINKYIFLMVAAVALLFTGCDDDDNTGASGIVPTNPTISVDLPAGGVNLVEAKQTFLFDVSISEPQVVDISIYISAIAGTATLGDDFTIDNGNSRVYIPAGKTSGQVSISVLEDELLEETETFTIQIGDERTANAVIIPVTVDFTLTNLTKDDLAVSLSWETDIKDVIGLEKDPDEVVDLRFLIVDAAGAIVETVDGDSFEDYTFVGADLSDGIYTLAVDLFSTLDFGDINAPITLDLSLQFDQVGAINAMALSFDDVMTNGLASSAFRANLATVTKAAGVYTIEKAVSYVQDNAALVGNYSGDDEGNASVIKTKLEGEVLQITGINNGWMANDWEEVVSNEIYVNVEVGFGTFVIPEQDYFTTIYNGDPYLYQISGTGSFAIKNGVTSMTINYALFQDGWSVNEYIHGAGGFFTATVILD